jgi:hypothetical protein
VKCGDGTFDIANLQYRRTRRRVRAGGGFIQRGEFRFHFQKGGDEIGDLEIEIWAAPFFSITPTKDIPPAICPARIRHLSPQPPKRAAADVLRGQERSTAL